MADAQQLTDVAEDDHAGVQGDDGVVAGERERVEPPDGRGAARDQPGVQAAGGVEVTVGQPGVEDDEVLADPRVGQGQAAQQHQQAGQPLLVRVDGEGDPAATGGGA